MSLVVDQLDNVKYGITTGEQVWERLTELESGCLAYG